MRKSLSSDERRDERSCETSSLAIVKWWTTQKAITIVDSKRYLLGQTGMVPFKLLAQHAEWTIIRQRWHVNLDGDDKNINPRGTHLLLLFLFKKKKKRKKKKHIHFFLISLSFYFFSHSSLFTFFFSRIWILGFFFY